MSSNHNHTKLNPKESKSLKNYQDFKFDSKYISSTNKNQISKTTIYNKRKEQKQNVPNKKNSNANFNSIRENSEDNKFKYKNTNKSFISPKNNDLIKNTNIIKNSNYSFKNNNKNYQKENDYNNYNNKMIKVEYSDYKQNSVDNTENIHKNRLHKDYNIKIYNNRNDNMDVEKDKNIVNMTNNKMVISYQTKEKSEIKQKFNSEYKSLNIGKNNEKLKNNNVYQEYDCINSIYIPKTNNYSHLYKNNNRTKTSDNKKDFDKKNSRNDLENKIGINKNYSFSSDSKFNQIISKYNENNKINKKINSNFSYCHNKASITNKDQKNNYIIPLDLSNLDKRKNQINNSNKATNYLISGIIPNTKNEKYKKNNNNEDNTIFTERKDNYRNKNMVNIENDGDIKNYSSNTYTLKNVNKDTFKEKGINTKNNKNLVIIPRKEPKIYTTKRPQTINNSFNEIENKNIGISYITNFHKLSNKSNSTTNTNINSQKINNLNNNSITYINTSSNKKEKKNPKRDKIVSKLKDNIKFQIKENINDLSFEKKDNKNINLNDIFSKIEFKFENKDNISDKNTDNLNLIKESKKSSNNNDSIHENEEENKSSPIKKDNIEKIENTNLDNKYINNSVAINNLNSSAKLEKKIKDLETKLDELNSNTSSFLNKIDQENNNYNKNSILDKPELSDITKEYLNTYLEEISTKNELSNYSKAYIMGLDGYNSINKIPTLSELTKEYLTEKEIKKEI